MLKNKNLFLVKAGSKNKRNTMKTFMKIKKVMLFVMAVIAVGAIATSCSGDGEAGKVATKLENGETLSHGDYTCMIEYLGKFAEKAQPIQDQINNLPAGDKSAEKYQEQLAALKDKYPLIEAFTSALDRATPEQVGSQNVALVDKYTGYEWFTAPAWAQENFDPAIGGIELQSPNDSNGVVAGAVDQEKVKL